MRALLILAMLFGPTSAHAQAALSTEALGSEIQLASDGAQLVVAVDRELRFYDFASHKQIGKRRVPDAIHLLDGKTFLASPNNDNALAMYADATGALVTGPRDKVFRSMVRGVAARGSMFAVTGTNDDAVFVWDGRALHRFDLGGDAGATNTVAFSPDGKHLAVGTRAHYVYEIDLAAWKIARQILRADGPIGALAYSRDGAMLVIGVDSGSTPMIVVETASGKAIDGPKKAPDNGVAALAFSADGAYLAVAGGEQRIHIYAVASWKQKVFLDGHFNPVTALAWSSDGKYLASSAAGELRLWAPFGE